MSDIQVSIQATGAEKAVRQLSSIEKAAERANRSMNGGVGGANSRGSQKKDTRGYAMLAFSQAVEDAQYGIRGVLNNIPQMLLFAGVAPQVAAGVSLIAVASVVAGPRLLSAAKELANMEKSAKKAENMKKSLQVVTDALDDFDRSYSKAAAQKDFEKQMESIGKSIGAPRKGLEDMIEAQDRASDAQSRLNALRRENSAIVNPKFDSAGAEARAQVTSMNEQIGNLKSQEEAARKALADLDANLAKAIFDGPEMKEGFIDKETLREDITAFTTFIETLEQEQKRLTDEVTKDEGRFKGNAYTNSLLAMLEGKELGTYNKGLIDSITKRKEDLSALESQLEAERKKLQLLMEQKKVQDDSVNAHNKELEAYNSEKKAIEDILKGKQENLSQSEAELLQLQNKVKALETRKQLDYMASLMEEMPNPNHFLDSRGRVGGSTAQAQNSINVAANYQRQANEYLKNIERNTRSKKSSTYL